MNPMGKGQASCFLRVFAWFEIYKNVVALRPDELWCSLFGSQRKSVRMLMTSDPKLLLTNKKVYSIPCTFVFTYMYTYVHICKYILIYTYTVYQPITYIIIYHRCHIYHPCKKCMVPPAWSWIPLDPFRSSTERIHRGVVSWEMWLLYFIAPKS